MKEYKDRFIAEALDLLSKLEKNLLLLEAQPDNEALIEDIFRDLHTLKGSSGMYGFEKIGHLMHLIESVFEKVRDKHFQAGNQIINLSLNLIDFTCKVYKSKEDVSELTFSEYNQLIERIESIIGKQSIQTDLQVDHAREKDPADVFTYFVTFNIDADFEKRGVKLDSLFQELNKLGNVISIPVNGRNKKSYKWEIFIVSNCSLYDLEDIFILLLDITYFQKLGDENLFLINEFNSTVQRNVSFKTTNDLEELKGIVAKAKESALEEKKKMKPMSRPHQTINKNFLKIGAEKLDEQMDLLSELVTAKAELRLIVETEKYAKLYKLIDALDKVTNSFRKNILNVRLVQVKTWYVMFLRLVRDVSKQLNKNVEFIAEGLETEIDKNIIDSLEAPLNHLIRNCLDHGIETSEERLQAGKPAKGSITLKAYHSGSKIIISIKDDGRGLDRNKIRSKAIDKGIIDPDTELTDKQLYDLVFLPGFSTALKVSEISGRGVGMDIVKKTINQLRGEIEINSEVGAGTEVIIKLPMLLSIIDTLLIRSGSQYFAIPLTDVNKCSQLKAHQLEQSDNHQLIVEGELIPYINLRQVFGIKGEQPDKQKIIIVTSSGNSIGLITDEVIGEYQAVLKPFDGYYINKQYFIGASLLADGNLCVILDTSKLLIEELNLTISSKCHEN